MMPCWRCRTAVAGEVWHAAVAGDQRAEIAGFGGGLEGLCRVSGCGVRQVGGLADAYVERVAGGLGAWHEGKAAGGGLVRERVAHVVTR